MLLSKAKNLEKLLSLFYHKNRFWVLNDKSYLICIGLQTLDIFPAFRKFFTMLTSISEAVCLEQIVKYNNDASKSKYTKAKLRCWYENFVQLSKFFLFTRNIDIRIGISIFDVKKIIIYLSSLWRYNPRELYVSPVIIIF